MAIEMKYSWEECMDEQTERYGDEDTAARVCASICGGKSKDADRKPTLEEIAAIEKDLGIVVDESGEEKGLKALDARLVVFKQGDAYRWVLTSSNAFEDREGEVISQAALEADVARMDQAGDYGPLRWWHVGAVDSKTLKAGKGLDLGRCDFNAMHGRILMESGTFDDPLVGAAIEKAADKLGGSIGFFHPLDEPDKEGTYKTIVRFERSLLPKEFAANGLVELTAVKEVSVEDEKIKQLRGLLGDELADSVLAKAGETEQKALEAGVRFKGEEKPPAPTGSVSPQGDLTPAKGGIVDKILGMAGLGKKEAAPEPAPASAPVPASAPAAKATKPTPAAMKEEDYTARVSAVSIAVGALNPPVGNGPWIWAENVFDDHVIITRGDEAWSVPYAWDESAGTATLASLEQWTEVMRVWQPKAPAATPAAATTQVKAGDDKPPEKPAEEKPPATIGTMTLEELTTLVKAMVTQLMVAASADQKARDDKAAGEVTRIEGELTKVKEASEALGKVVADLISEQPRAMAEALRVSVSAETDLSKLPQEVQDRLKGKAPGPDKHFTDRFIDGIVASGKGMAPELVQGGGPAA